MLVSLPVLVPLFAGILALILGRNMAAQRGITVVSSFIQMVLGGLLLWTVWTDGIQSVQFSNWQAPFGITLVADLLSAIMVLVTGIIAFGTALYVLGDADEARQKFGYHAFLQIMLMGINGAFLTGDIFNLFVWFEVMLIASFVLMALGGERPQMEGAVKYVTLNLVSSTLFLTGVGLLYGKVGSLNMAHLAVQISEHMDPQLITVTAVLFMVSFGIKAGIFPLYFWLPASYHTPPAAISAIFAGLLTKVGVYALIRVFTLIFTTDISFTHTILLTCAAFTMLFGVFGAVVQFDFRRLLSFHIISQIGYMILGLALNTVLGLAGAVFYLFHHIIVKANLYFVSGIANHLHGTYDLKKLGGLYRSRPFLAFLFLIPAMSLAGIPPLSGFFAKLSVTRAGLEAQEWLVVGISLFVGLLTLYSMTKIWAEAFWKKLPEKTEAEFQRTISPKKLRYLYSTVIFLAAITITIGLQPNKFFQVAIAASEQLFDRSQYVEAVLGEEAAERIRELDVDRFQGIHPPESEPRTEDVESAVDATSDEAEATPTPDPEAAP